MDHLVGASQIAGRLGLRRTQHVHQLRRRDRTFPAPVLQLKDVARGAYLWYWPDVEEWAKKTGRIRRGAT